MDISNYPVHDRAALLRELVEERRVCCRRRWGTQHRLRRWMNMTSTSLRFPEEGSLLRRAVIGIGFATLGLPVQWLVDRFTQGAAIVARDGHSGLDVHLASYDGAPAWMVTRYWAWPIGRGHGRTVIAALIDAADRADVCLVLQAGNRHLACEFYAPMGFTSQRGQECKRRPRLVREPATTTGWRAA